MPIQLDIVTPDQRLLSLQVDSLRAPAADGSFGVLPGHTPFVAAMQPGELSFTVGGGERHYFVGGGFVQVLEDRVIVLAEGAEPVEAIELVGAEQALREAEERLKGVKAEEEERGRIERARVQRAAARVALARRRGA